MSYDKDYMELRGKFRNSEVDKSLLERLTVGNLGFSQAICDILPMKFSGHNIARPRCRTGVISELIDFGVTTRIED